jgi:hypothetical protein
MSNKSSNVGTYSARVSFTQGIFQQSAMRIITKPTNEEGGMVGAGQASGEEGLVSTFAAGKRTA